MAVRVYRINGRRCCPALRGICRIEIRYRRCIDKNAVTAHTNIHTLLNICESKTKKGTRTDPYAMFLGSRKVSASYDVLEFAYAFSDSLFAVPSDTFYEA